MGPRNFKKSTEAKILSHTKEFTRIQNGDRKLKHRTRDTARGISSNRSNIARAMRVRMPKVPSNFAPTETTIQSASTSAPQISAPQSSELIIAPPPTNHTAELTLPSTSGPMEALQQILPRTTKRARKSSRYVISNSNSLKLDTLFFMTRYDNL